ncbi:hypothetical protein SALBM217S_05953 [Streptomyces griseoloalbus]
MPAPRTVLLTGAAGGLGTLMRELLPPYGYDLRLFDMRPVDGAPDAIVGDLGDRDAVREAVRGVDAVVHLAGISLESSFDKILKANIEGTYHLYEAAREEGVRRIVFASSNHAVGYTPRPRGRRPADPRRHAAPAETSNRAVQVLRGGPGPAVLGQAQVAWPDGLRADRVVLPGADERADAVGVDESGGRGAAVPRRADRGGGGAHRGVRLLREHAVVVGPGVGAGAGVLSRGRLRGLRGEADRRTRRTGPPGPVPRPPGRPLHHKPPIWPY